MTAAELFEETEALGGEADDRGRARSPRGARAVLATGPSSPGPWAACTRGAHRDCAVGPVLVQASWATAGLEPPSTGAAPASWETCPCACHARKVSR